MRHLFSYTKKYIIFVYTLVLMSCGGIQSDIDPEGSGETTESLNINEEVKSLKTNLNRQEDKLERLERNLASYKNMIEDQNSSIKTFQKKLETELNKSLDVLAESDNNNLEQQLTNSLMRIQTKIKILEDRAFYTDSLYFEMVNDLVMVENKISSLLTSYQEMTELKSKKKVRSVPKISDEQYTAKYIESLSEYQNGEWNKSLDGFSYLISADDNHDLADNCQYWIGEIYYALKDYRRSIKEFEKVFTFSGTNKGDDAQFKLGLCYINIGDAVHARAEFKSLMEFYPNSEYYKKSQKYLQQD